MIRCNTCGQPLANRQAIIDYHVNNLHRVFDMIDSGQFYVEDFPDLQRLARLVAGYPSVTEEP